VSAAIERVGELYANQEYFVPELLLCSDALYAGPDILRPHIKTNEAEVKKQLVIGVVEGDVHDIGKNLVKIMFDAAGWAVHNLGNDTKLERFAKEQRWTKADIVALSALMTASMVAIPKVIEMVKAQDPKVVGMGGGAPLNREIATGYGADGYARQLSERLRKRLDLSKVVFNLDRGVQTLPLARKTL
jgi:methanogenic corrinoid protein MtbC1